MKKLLFLIFIIFTQISFAQFTFKHESNIIKLEEIDNVDKKISNAPNKAKDNGYSSKLYKTNLGDTLTILPQIAVVVKNAD